MILLFVWFYLSVSGEIWSKCSKPCGTGEQTNELGLKRKCNFEDCFAYDVIRLHQVSGSSNYDDVMTKQVPGVPGANLVGRHLPSVPYVPRC